MMQKIGKEPGTRAKSPDWSTALITGASSGIGEALARNLARRGVHVLLAARRLPELKRIAIEIRRQGGVATPVRLDVSKTSRLTRQLALLDKRIGGIDLVVANAGVGVSISGQKIPSWSWPAVEPVLQTNFIGAIATVTALLPRMIARGRGQVAAISSLAGYGALPDAAGYVSPKAGLSRFMECLALDLQSTGIAVSAVHVGFVATQMVAKSTIPLPFLLPVDKAAERIVTGLIRKKREINFPFIMVVFVRLMALLPFGIKAYFSRRYYRNNRG